MRLWSCSTLIGHVDAEREVAGISGPEVDGEIAQAILTENGFEEASHCSMLRLLCRLVEASAITYRYVER